MQLHVLEPLFKIFYTFVGKNFSSCRLKFPGKNCRHIYRKSKASVSRNLSTVTAPQNLLVKSLAVQLQFRRGCPSPQHLNRTCYQVYSHSPVSTVCNTKLRVSVRPVLLQQPQIPFPFSFKLRNSLQQNLFEQAAQVSQILSPVQHPCGPSLVSDQLP